MTDVEQSVAVEQPVELGERLPFFLCDRVIKGFGRGSKQLGIPTANLPTTNYAGMLECNSMLSTCIVGCEAAALRDVVDSLVSSFEALPTGVYLGWAQVRLSDDSSVYPMAMSIGWNPFFKNEQKTIVSDQQLAPLRRAVPSDSLSLRRCTSFTSSSPTFTTRSCAPSSASTFGPNAITRRSTL
jgi:hypothetical protein